MVLLSGGMDSATCLAAAVRDFSRVHALSVRYGQRHARETRSARALARHFAVREHRTIRLPLQDLAASALTSPRARLPSAGPRPGRIPSTYVPARNTVFLALALAFAETRKCDAVFIGANAIDYSGYPDCRPAFLRAFERVAALGTRAGIEGTHRVRIRAPLLRLAKAGIVRLGDRLEVPWELTWSCYAGGRVPCGTCDACRLRAKGFREAGRTDPLVPRRARRRAVTRPGSYRRRSALP